MAQCEGCAAWVHAHCDEHAWRLLHPPNAPPSSSSSNSNNSSSSSHASKHFFCPSCVVDPQCTQHFGPLPLLPPSSSSAELSMESTSQPHQPLSTTENIATATSTVEDRTLTAQAAAAAAAAETSTASATTATTPPSTALPVARTATTPAPLAATPPASDKAAALAMKASAKAGRRAAKHKVRQQWEAQKAQRSNAATVQRVERRHAMDARAKALAAHHKAREAYSRAENRHRIGTVNPRVPGFCLLFAWWFVRGMIDEGSGWGGKERDSAMYKLI